MLNLNLLVKFLGKWFHSGSKELMIRRWAGGFTVGCCNWLIEFAMFCLNLRGNEQMSCILKIFLIEVSGPYIVC